MIDTVMALWNHRSQYRAVRIFLTLSFICISISLLLVTIVIPGYILFMQQANNGITATSLQSNAVAPMQGGGSMFVATPKALGTPSTKVVARKCLTPTPHKRSHTKAHTRENIGQQAQTFVPPSIPTPPSLRESHKGTKGAVASHPVYAGRPKASVSHILTSGPQGSISRQNVQATVEPLASAIVPHASPTIVEKTQPHLHSRVSFVEVPLQPNFPPIHLSSPVAHVIKDACSGKAS